ncbi:MULTISPECIES: DUF3800 domain-containing protein [unclassified Archaeoglobus]|jgi:hypothetical protein|uniref:DUF3800 domain-containing protein n=1 Tax=unclassified Archaeoglobus TaxID=2643606 RepID=UPI0025BC27DF|nr:MULTISPECIES: DUF3800 domain-containing protein [unclassified Archaeoglobus]
MWVAYIDESGNPNFNNEQEIFYAASAIIIHDSHITALNREIEKIKRNILPKKYRNLELHANEIVHGNKNYKGLKLDKRIELMDALHDYIGSDSNITIISVVMDKKRINETIDSRINLKKSIVAEKTRKQLYRLLIERLAWYITNNGLEWMLLMIDESGLSHQKGTTNDLENEIVRGVYASTIPGSKYIIVPPLFAPSHKHIGIQLADVVTYTISKWIAKKRYEITKKYFDFDKYFRCIIKRLDKDNSGQFKGYGLKYWDSPTYLNLKI